MIWASKLQHMANWFQDTPLASYQMGGEREKKGYSSWATEVVTFPVLERFHS